MDEFEMYSLVMSLPDTLMKDYYTLLTTLPPDEVDRLCDGGKTHPKSAKDRLAVKPMIMYENDDLIAIASEEVSLNRLFPGQALNTKEPPPGSYDTWSRST